MQTFELIFFIFLNYDYGFGLWQTKRSLGSSNTTKELNRKVRVSFSLVTIRNRPVNEAGPIRIRFVTQSIRPVKPIR